MLNSKENFFIDISNMLQRNNRQSLVFEESKFNENFEFYTQNIHYNCTGVHTKLPPKHLPMKQFSPTSWLTQILLRKFR